MIKQGFISSLWLACSLLLASLAAAFMTSIALLHPSDHWVVPPGREAAVLAWLAPVRARGFGGAASGDVQIDRDEVRVMIGPADPSPPIGAPAWLRARSAVSLRRSSERVEKLERQGGWDTGTVSDGAFALSWIVPASADHRERMAEARGLLAQLAADDRGAIFEDKTGPDASLGLLTPWARIVRLPARIAAPLTLSISLLLTAGAAVLISRRAQPAKDSPPRPAPCRRAVQRSRNAVPGMPKVRPSLWWALCGAIALLGLANLWSAACTESPDADESWAYNIGSGVLNQDHDAWIHPPLHRALQQAWVRKSPAVHKPGPPREPPDRTLSLLFVGAALLILTLRAAQGAPNVPVIAAMMAIAGSELITSQLVLARPYALAALLVSILALGLVDDEQPWAIGRWLMVGWAAVLLGWTDLVAAGVMAPLIAARLLVPGPGRSAQLALAAALACASIAIVPGAFLAVTEFSQPPWPVLRNAAEQQGREAMRAFGIAVRMFLPLGDSTIPGAAALVTILVWSNRSGRHWLAWGLGATMATAALIGSAMAVRERHFAVLAFACLALVIWLSGRSDSWHVPRAGGMPRP